MVLRDASGKKIGEIKDRGDRQRIYDAHGKYLGEYDPSSNVTKDASGKKIGQGNLLASLVK